MDKKLKEMYSCENPGIENRFMRLLNELGDLRALFKQSGQESLAAKTDFIYKDVVAVQKHCNHLEGLTFHSKEMAKIVKRLEELDGGQAEASSESKLESCHDCIYLDNRSLCKHPDVGVQMDSMGNQLKGCEEGVERRDNIHGPEEA